MDKIILFVERNLQGLEYRHYLFTADDFKKMFAPDIDAEEWNNFLLLATLGAVNNTDSMEWSLSACDTMEVTGVLTENTEKFIEVLSDILDFDEELDDEITELILNNKDPLESIVATIERYCDIKTSFDADNSSPILVEFAARYFPDLAKNREHRMTFEDAYNAIKDNLCFDECAACEEHIAELKVALNERLTRWNGSKYVLPQGHGAWRMIAERLAAYENLGTVEELENAIRVNNNQSK